MTVALLIAVVVLAVAALITHVVTQGIIMAKLDSVSSKLDALTTALNEETNALAARIDAFEIAVGSTVTQVQIDNLKGISDRLKSLGSDPAAPIPSTTPAPVVDAPVDVAPATTSLRPSAAPKAAT